MVNCCRTSIKYAIILREKEKGGVCSEQMEIQTQREIQIWVQSFEHLATSEIDLLVCHPENN